MGRWLLRSSLAILTLFVLARAASAAQTGGPLYAGPPYTGSPPLAGGPPSSAPPTVYCPTQSAPMPCGYIDGGIVPGPGGGGYVSANPPYVPGPPPAYVDPDPPYVQGPPVYATGGGQYSGGQYSGGSSYSYSQTYGGDRYGPPQPGPGCDPCQQQGGGYVQGYVTGYRDGYRDGYGDALYGGGYSQQSYDRRWNSGCGCYPPPAPCQSTPRYDCRTGEVSLNNSFFYDSGGVGPAVLSYGGGGGGGYAGAGASSYASASASSSVSIRYGGRGGGRPPKRGGCGCK
jgi:hypothetical protein